MAEETLENAVEVETEQAQPEEENKKHNLITWLKEHPKTVFWTRFVFWTLLACVLPFIFIVWRFELFQPISKIQIGGWGIIAIVIVAVFAFAIIRYIRLALSAKYSLISQCLSGFCKIIIPLCVIMVILYNIKSNIDLFLQVMGVVTVCEAVAIPINPLPKWAYECQKEVRDGESK